MELSPAIASIALALALGAISPGPSFVMVARTALAVSRRDGVATAVGMGVGGVVFSAVALLGLLAFLATVPLFRVTLKTLGGGYLLYLGYRIWRGAREPLRFDDASIQGHPTPIWRSFILGLTTQLSNPKTAVVYASVFASLLPSAVPPYILFVLPVMIFVIETTWYSVVAIALSASPPRTRYLATKAWLDRTAGAIMSALGVKLILEAQQP